jgi:hypothetical protein
LAATPSASGTTAHGEADDMVRYVDAAVAEVVKEQLMKKSQVELETKEWRHCAVELVFVKINEDARSSLLLYNLQ